MYSAKIMAPKSLFYWVQGLCMIYFTQSYQGPTQKIAKGSSNQWRKADSARETRLLGGSVGMLPQENFKFESL